MTRPVSSDRERVCAMYRRGVPVPEIAFQFSVNPPAVRGMLRRAGVYQPKWTQESTKGALAEARLAPEKASLAEHMADGGTIAGWERVARVKEGRGHYVWGRIRADLGAQAC